jgi:hypothetical protein
MVRGVRLLVLLAAFAAPALAAAADLTRPQALAQL